MELRPIKSWTITRNQLVSFDATILYGANDIQNTHKLLLIDVYANMIASGKWAVRGSSDASTAAMDDTNRLSVVADVRFAVTGGSIHSWIVLEQLATGMHVLWNHEHTSDGGSKHNMELYVSRNAFTGGSTTARPTTTEEAFVRRGSGSGLLAKWHRGQSGVDWRWHAWHSVDGKSTMIGCWQAGTLRSWWEFTDLRYVPDEWVTPWAISMAPGNNNTTDFFDYDACWNAEESQAIYAPQIIPFNGAFSFPVTHTADNDAGAAVNPIYRQITAVNPTSNEIDVFPAGLFNLADGFYGTVGYYFDKYWSGVGVTGDLHPDEDGDNWVKIGPEGVFVPWLSATVFQTS